MSDTNSKATPRDLTAGTLSKVVPAHRKTVKFSWVKRDFMLFGFYRSAREKRHMRIQSACYWCKSKFGDGDMMALAAITGTGNKLLCQPCASQVSE